MENYGLNKPFFLICPQGISTQTDIYLLEYRGEERDRVQYCRCGTGSPDSLNHMKNKFMKYMISIIVLGVILGGMYLLGGMNSTNVEYRQGETIEKPVEVNPLDKQIEIREKELEEKYTKIKSIEARIDVNVAEIERLNAQVKADRAELSGFMTATASGR